VRLTFSIEESNLRTIAVESLFKHAVEKGGQPFFGRRISAEGEV